MRIFACTLLSEALQTSLSRGLARAIAASGGLLRPIPRDSAHLTYAFVGDALEERQTEFVAAITAVAARHEPIVIRFGAPFVLYGSSEARLVCAPVATGAAGLASLAFDIVASLKIVLKDADVQGSRSHHVTLARFRKRTRRAEALPVERALEHSVLAGVQPEERVERLQLMSSALTPAGPVYTPLVDVPLGPPVFSK